MNVRELKEAELELDTMIRKCADDHKLTYGNILPIYDGIFDAKKYLNSPVKIMWILNEPNITKGQKGSPLFDVWHLNKCLFDNPVIKLVRNNTLKTVARISYGILHNLEWDKIDAMTIDNGIGNSLQEIALINISKMPLHSQTNNNLPTTNYAWWKEVLLKQIEVYDPEVIIFGNNYRLIKNDLPLNKETIVESPYMNLIEYGGNKLLVDTWNPGKVFNRDEKGQYADEIISGINNWLKKKAAASKAVINKYFHCIVKLLA